MKLTKLSARNFKGLTFTLDLAAINFLVGSNFAGKTARTDAVRLLLLGYLPELGKTAKATFSLASGREMTVEGEFDNGTRISRRWVAKGDSIKTDFSGVDAENDEADERTEQQLAIMLDANTYFALGPTDRVRYVFENCPMPTRTTPFDVVNAVEAALQRKEVAPELVADVVAKLSPRRDAEEMPAAEFVGEALEAAAEIAKTAKDVAGRMEKTAQGLAGLRAQDEKVVSIEALDAERAVAAAEVSRLTEEKGRLAGAYEAARNAKRRREELASAVKAKAGFETRKESLARQIDDAENDLGKVPPIEEEAVEAFRTTERDASMALRDHERDLRQVVESIANNERELAGVDEKDKCPYCGASGDGWKALKVGEINSALAGLRAKKGQLEEHVGKLRATVEDAGKRLSEARESVAERRAIAARIEALRRDLDAVEKQLALIEGKEQELAALPADDSTAIAALETVQTALNVANGRLSEIDGKRRLALGRKNDLERLAQAETERDKAKAEESTAKAAVDALKEIQRKMVEDAFGPLLATANSFFGSILKTPLAYNADKGEIGTWRGGTWVSHATFSGVEKLVCYAAIQAALAAKAPVRVMILDEMLRAQGDVFKALVRSCKAAVREGRLDQFVGIIPGSPVAYAELAESDCAVAEVA